jgi:hypothetical protein
MDGSRTWKSAVVAFLLLAVIASAAVGCGKRKKKTPPDQTQPPARVAAIQALDLQRSGRVRVTIHHLSPTPEETDEGETIRFVVQSPRGVVEDTDIRGFLDGKTKYDFNQGTAYHMRAGRRIDGPYDGELELKRSLVRWKLPRIPRSARISDVRVHLWVEGFSLDSPIREDASRLPMHLYAYPVDQDWNPGRGGVGADSFSEAAPGEASWSEARAGERAWPAPGGLALGSTPVAVGRIEGDDRWVELGGGELRRFLEQCLAEGRSLDLLFKLDDVEEDRWGTEIALLTSNFGDDRDAHSKRPRLELDLVLPLPEIRHEESFILEPGQEKILPILQHGGSPVLVNASFPDAPEEPLQPGLWIRGGGSDQKGEADWAPVHGPMVLDWDWCQLKVSAAPEPMLLGETFEVRLQEPWVSPGPREVQRPELVLIAPSGQVHRVDGRPVDKVNFEITFTPDEPGLWRYGWSYLPRSKSPRGSHQGEGLFYVRVPQEGNELEQFRSWAASVGDALEGRPSSQETDQYRLNAAVRWAANLAQRNPEDRQEVEAILRRLRRRLPKRFQPREPEPSGNIGD